MSDDEVDELLKAVDTSSGEINYTGTLVSQLSVNFAPSTELTCDLSELVRTILAN
jgi:hypothetical protein